MAIYVYMLRKRELLSDEIDHHLRVPFLFVN